MLAGCCRRLLRLPAASLTARFVVATPRARQCLRNAATDAPRAAGFETADEFGNLDPSYNEKILPQYQFSEDDNDEQDRHDAKVADIYRPGKEDFLRQLNELIHEKKDLKRALEVFQLEMKEECVQPLQPHYRLMIHACAEAGYTKKAFQLFREFRARDLPRHKGILADLFLACSNCHDKAYALTKATLLLHKLRAEHFNPNRVIYNTMIQAFGRCGDLKTAFALVDEMQANQFELASSTFSFLLHGCIQDKESGFRHALLVWRNMRQRGIHPGLFNYNLILRSARDCGLGAAQYAEDILLASLPRKPITQGKTIGLKAGNVRDKKQQQHKRQCQQQPQQQLQQMLPSWLDIQVPDSQKGGEVVPKLPNLLAVRPDINNVLALNSEDSPQNRLQLLGGSEGVVDLMAEEGVVPDIKTLSILLQLENSSEAEDKLIQYIDKYNIQPDTAFVNQLIKARAFRGEQERGIATLQLMSKWGLTPDVLTFGCLALCCSNLKAGNRLMADMKALGTRLNVEIMTALMRSAEHNKSPREMAAYLAVVEREGLLPNRRMLEVLEQFYQTYRGWIRTKEAGGYVPYAVVLEMRNDLRHWRAFAAAYRTWLARTPGDLTNDPWDQYKISKDVEREEAKMKLKRQDR